MIALLGKRQTEDLKVPGPIPGHGERQTEDLKIPGLIPGRGKSAILTQMKM